MKVKPVAEIDLDLPVSEGFAFVQALRLELGGVTPMAPLHLSVPAPPGASAQNQVLVTSAIQLPRRLAWSLVDRAHLIDGKYQTASPPFPGAIGQKTYVFVTSTFPCISYVTVTYNSGFDTLWLPFTLPVVPFVYLTAGSVTKATLSAT